MGIDYGRIVLDRPNGTYYSGQTIRGNLIFQQDTVKTFRGIFVRFRGCCKVHWTVTERIRDETQTKNHDSYDEYINMKVILDGGESGKNYIQPGKYDYPFTFHVPANSPSSFEGKYGHVRYEIKAVVDRVFKLDQERVAIRVLAPIDLNLDPYCREPLQMEINETYCCWCFRAGTIETVINAPMSGYCPGQKIPIDITCTNKGNVDIRHIKIRIVKDVEFIATRHRGRRSEKDVVVEIKKGSVLGNTTRNWTVDMEVPTVDVYNLSGCSYINIEYRLEVVVSANDCHSDREESRKIIIGTIPLVGFQDNVVKPLQDQMPQQITAVTRQPMSSYPATSPYPYPGNHAQYPTNVPYPNNSNQNPPYSIRSAHLNPNAPFPTNYSFNIPYDNPPYSSSNPRYLSNNSSISPYPATNLTYPIVSFNAVINPAYHSENLPYPDSPPPYPGNDSPYPAGQQNTSNEMGSIRGSNRMGSNVFGNIGFTAAAVPISPNPVNPYTYVAASAPTATLDSPDAEKCRDKK